MPTQTLVEAARYSQDDLISGVAVDIIDVDPSFTVMPWTSYDGQGIIVNREDILGDSQIIGVDELITAKNPMSGESDTFTSVTLIGDVEINGLVNAQSGAGAADQLSLEIASKAKSVGRLMQGGIAAGLGVGNSMNSMHSLCDASQYAAASGGRDLSFELLDELLDLVTSKDGEVDFIKMNGKTLRKYKALVRTLGGVAENIIYKLPSGQTRSVSSYNGVPIFKSDYLKPTEMPDGLDIIGGNLSSVYAGVWDDGTRKVGSSMIHPAGTLAGLDVEPVGIKTDKDEMIYRVKSYCNFALFNRRGLARLTSIN